MNQKITEQSWLEVHNWAMKKKKEYGNAAQFLIQLFGLKPEYPLVILLIPDARKYNYALRLSHESTVQFMFERLTKLKSLRELPHPERVDFSPKRELQCCLWENFSELRSEGFMFTDIIKSSEGLICESVTCRKDDCEQILRKFFIDHNCLIPDTMKFIVHGGCSPL